IAEPSWSGATPSRSITAPAKKMGAVPIHRVKKSPLPKTPKKVASKSVAKKKVGSKVKA
ncbi:MAG: peptidase, partial [Polynucleobacter sp. 24-46-87]